jgi:hypothetical protein
MVFEGLPGALMSISGTHENDVWAVGADTEAHGATILNYDGTEWRQYDGPAGIDLWWVHVFDAGSVFVAGSGGTILRFEGGQFQPMATPGTDTVFGVWGATPNDVWAVGGDVAASGSAFVWRFDGNAWSDVSEQLPFDARGIIPFKVWGAAANDLWLVGMDGLAVHFDGAAFSLHGSSTTRRLLTVHGAGMPARAVAVGGFGDAVIVENDGNGWLDATPADRPPELFGVCMTSATEGYAVGATLAIVRRDGTGWHSEETEFRAAESLHSVWIDPAGGVWAAGGDLAAPPYSRGLLLHKGPEIENGFAD